MAESRPYAMASDAQARIGARVDELVTAFADGRLDEVLRETEIVR